MGGLAAAGLSALARSSQSAQLPAEGPGLSAERRARYEAMHARMMAALRYERVTVPGERALAEWERLKGAGRGWPVVVGNDEDLERIADQYGMGDPAVSGASLPGMSVRSPAEILTAASTLRFPGDLRKWPGAARPEELRAPLGEWPAKVDGEGPAPSVAVDLASGKFHDRVHILLLPTRSGWEVPAYLRWGDWNACPPPEYHVAALREWHGRFGAELVGISGDSLDVRVREPVRDRKQALALARDQYAYCPDIVDQGVVSISALAATLAASEWWYFWWD